MSYVEGPWVAWKIFPRVGHASIPHSRPVEIRADRQQAADCKDFRASSLGSTQPFCLLKLYSTYLTTAVRRETYLEQSTYFSMF